MTTGSRQAFALARALSAATATSCVLELHGGDGWRVHWSDGPAETEMRAAVAAHAPRVAPTLDATRIGFERGYSDLGVAVQLLWWLAEDYPDGAGPIDLWLPLRGGADVLPGSPEHAPATVRRRAEVLIEHGWNPATHSALDIGIELEDHARTGGWRHVGAWLDRLSRPATTATLPSTATTARTADLRGGGAEQEDPTVDAAPVGLSAYRRRTGP